MRREGRASATALACLALTAGLVACAPSGPTPAREVTFACPDGATIDATFPVGGGSVVLDIDGERVELPRAYAAIGAEFRDERTTFYTTGDWAVLIRDGQTQADCAGDVPSGPWITFGAQNSNSTWRWPGYTKDRRTLWQWSDLRGRWR